ncbi:MAG: hypothetical protein QM811_06620 [Pirellulales bacterium]
MNGALSPTVMPPEPALGPLRAGVVFFTLTFLFAFLSIWVRPFDGVPVFRMLGALPKFLVWAWLLITPLGLGRLAASRRNSTATRAAHIVLYAIAPTALLNMSLTLAWTARSVAGIAAVRNVDRAIKRHVDRRRRNCVGRRVAARARDESTAGMFASMTERRR